MFQRFPSILVLFVVFASMWMHGSFPVVQDRHHDMIGHSCLEHCLKALHIDSADASIGVPSFSSFFHPAVKTAFSYASIAGHRALYRESHHDPGRVLKTIQRE